MDLHVHSGMLQVVFHLENIYVFKCVCTVLQNTLKRVKK